MRVIFVVDAPSSGQNFVRFKHVRLKYPSVRVCHSAARCRLVLKSEDDFGCRARGRAVEPVQAVSRPQRDLIINRKLKYVILENRNRDF